MKITIHLLTLAAISLVFSSCCSIIPCVGSLSAQKEVTKFKNVKRTVHDGKTSRVVVDRVPVTNKRNVSKWCIKNGSSFNPYSECAGIVNKEVTARASAQGGGGEPNIGLIPTMKDLPYSP